MKREAISISKWECYEVTPESAGGDGERSRDALLKPGEKYSRAEAGGFIFIMRPKSLICTLDLYAAGSPGLEA